MAQPAPAPTPTPQAAKAVNPLTSLLKDSSTFEKIIYCMLIFVPLAFVAEYAGLGSTLTFFFSCLGITPLAKLMSTATEELAAKAGSGIGGLLNATFGNAVELIIAVFGLIGAQQNPKLLDVVKASITGSIIGNLLLVLGVSMLVGGWGRSKQTFNAVGTRASSTLLTLAAIALIMPAVFAQTLDAPTTDAQRNSQQNLLESLSLGVAVILIISYGAQLVFSLRTHAHLYTGEEGHTDEESRGWSVTGSLIVLVVATITVGFMAEFLVGSVEELTSTLGWTELFVGVILIAIVGNAAEYVAAVTAAMKNKMDLALGVAVGATTQIATFVAPVLIFIGFFLGGNSELNLIFSPFELVAVILAVVIVNLVVNDGESNWLEGLQLTAAYLIIAVAFFLHPALPPTFPLKGH